MVQVSEIENYIQNLLPVLGVNKQRELVRLLYEIAKRDGKILPEILPAEKNLTFERAKKILLQKRYPRAFATAPKNAFYLPKLELDAVQRADLTERPFYPKQIYIESAVQDSPLAARAKRMFPNAKFEIIDKKQLVGSENFSRRTETLLIHKEQYDFVKPCPCSQGSAGCGYNLINLGFGCRFECEYCFLQQ